MPSEKDAMDPELLQKLFELGAHEANKLDSDEPKIELPDSPEKE